MSGEQHADAQVESQAWGPLVPLSWARMWSLGTMGSAQQYTVKLNHKGQRKNSGSGNGSPVPVRNWRSDSFAQNRQLPGVEGKLYFQAPAGMIAYFNISALPAHGSLGYAETQTKSAALVFLIRRAIKRTQYLAQLFVRQARPAIPHD